MRILKSYGTDGGVLVNSSDIPEGIDLKEPATIVFDGLPVPFFIEEIREKGSRAVIKFEDVDSLAQAEELVGKDAVFSSESDQNESEFEAIIGFKIIDANDGSLFGTVSNYYDIPGNPCLCVMHDGKEVLVPFHEDLIRKFSRRSKSITIDIPHGLA